MPAPRDGGGRLTGVGWLLLAVLFAVPAYVVVVTPFALEWQALCAVVMIGAALLMRHAKSRQMLIALMVVSLLASSRYLYWRLTQTLPIGPQFDGWDLFLASGLVFAELYAYVILLFGFVQTAWPLGRKPVPLPEDESSWPTVDVFIPTYN